jgi:hypothetical protein
VAMTSWVTALNPAEFMNASAMLTINVLSLADISIGVRGRYVMITFQSYFSSS